MKRARSIHVTRTVLASLWMFGGRLLSLVWSLLLIHQFGISGFGSFTVGIAGASLILIPLDAYFVVTGVRVNEESFVRDRTTRLWLGLFLLGVGLILFNETFILGLALSKAGADVAFNAYKSESIRNGQPDVAYRLDVWRQSLSLGIGGVVLAVDGNVTLPRATLFYLLGYAPLMIAALPMIKGVRPALPERTRRTGTIVIDSIGAAAYMQADIVLIGMLASKADAGYFSLGSLAVWLVGGVGQNFSSTFHESLRAAKGATSGGPRIVHTSALAATSVLAMLVLSLGLWLAGADRQLWMTFAILSVVAGSRFLSGVFTTVLILQSRDRTRMVITVVSAVIKLVGIAILGSAGSVGAAIAFVVSDIFMALCYLRVIYGSPRASMRPGQ
ncbi:MAG: oligosaccharide flippase family protein [Aeromicrobium sp.]